MSNTHCLTAIRTVMVNTSHPGNIGAAARALKTMGLSQLYLVNPKMFPHAEATARAAGADDILTNTLVTHSLADALRGCHLVFACSARQRSLAWPTLSPRESAKQIIAHTQQGHKVAILFGNEASGLSNASLQHCHYQIHIPSNPIYSSLNLAAAVQIIAYEINSTQQALTHPTTKPLPLARILHYFGRSHEISGLASSEHVHSFYNHLERLLIDSGFLDLNNPQQLMYRLRRLFARAQLDDTEINILHGVLTAIANHSYDSHDRRDEKPQSS